MELKATFKDVIASLDFSISGYALSDIREMLEKRLQSVGVGVGKHKTSKLLLSRLLIVGGATVESIYKNFRFIELSAL